MFRRSVVLLLASVFVAFSPYPLKGAESGTDRAGKRSMPQPIPEGVSADLKEQIENLYSSDRKTRADAAGRLGAMKERARSATPYLVDVLKNDEAWDVRMWAATALAMTKDAKALKPLIDALKDEGGIVRETGSFSNFFDKEVTRRDVQHYVRRFAAYALGELGDREAVKPLAGVLHDEDPEVRAFAANALQKIGDKEATMPLKEALKKEKHEKARQAIEVAIKELESLKGEEKRADKQNIGKEPAGETVIDTRVVVCDVPADILRRLQDKSLRYLMIGPADKQQTTVIGSGQAGSSWRSTVSEKQPKSGASVKFGTLWLGTPDPSFNVEFELRQEAFNAPFKAEATWHEVNSELVLIGAVSTLGLQFESDETYPITIRCMKDGWVYLCGRGTIRAQDGKVTKLGENHTVAFWVKVCGDKREEVRQGAIQALGYLARSEPEKENTLPHVVAALKDESWRVRRDAAITLSKIGTGEQQATIGERLQKEESPTVKAALQYAKEKLESPRQ